MREPQRQGAVVAGIFFAVLFCAWGVARVLSNGDELQIAHPWALTLWILVPAVALCRLGDRGAARRVSFGYSDVSLLRLLHRNWITRWARLPTLLRISALLLIVVALTRPHSLAPQSKSVEGLDLMFVLDVSQSMEETDLQRNRLDAGQRVIRKFLHKRAGKGDRIGLVVFAKEAMLQCPLTLDYHSLDTIVSTLQIGDVPPLGTALGDALGLALAGLLRSQLRSGHSTSKAIILLSDGDWNKAHYMDPFQARDLAVQEDVRIFSVLLGREERRSRGANAHYAVNSDVLSDISTDTKGLFLKAGNDLQLSASFEKIRQALPKTEKEVIGSTPHLQFYRLLLWPAFLLLLVEIFLGARWHRGMS